MKKQKPGGFRQRMDEAAAMANAAMAKLPTQARVDAAIQDFISWQTTEIGRDINPTELIRRVREAGAKRVLLTSPVFATVQETEVARLGSKKVTYGGLEDD